MASRKWGKIMEYKDISSVRRTEEKLLLVMRNMDQLPSERNISDEMGVSRSVVRSAIQHLESENSLIRVDGKLRSNKSISINMLGSGSMSEELQMDNTNSEIIQYSNELVNAHDEKIKEFFQLSENSKLIKLVRIRKNNGVPISYEVAYMNYNKFPKVLDTNFDGKSLYKILEKLYSVNVAYGREEISCVKADQTKSQILGMGEESPLFKVSSFNYDDNDNPIEHTDQYLSASRFQYILHAKNIFDYKGDLD